MILVKDNHTRQESKIGQSIWAACGPPYLQGALQAAQLNATQWQRLRTPDAHVQHRGLTIAHPVQTALDGR